MTRNSAWLGLLVAATLSFSWTFPNSALAQTVSFATQTFPSGPNPQVVAVGDFNGDGKLDLAVANAGSTTVSVLLGNGDGTFQTPLTVDAGGSNPTYVVAADFNGDGKLDLAVATYGCFGYGAAGPCPTVSNTISVLLGNGDGTFQAARTFEAGSGPNAVAVGDFNADGKLDLAVADYGPSTLRATTVSVLLGNGDGTFQAPLTFQAGRSPAFVAVADFNGDGKLDLVVANYDGPPTNPTGPSTVSVLLGNGDGTFQAAQSLGVGSGPWYVAVSDFNGDGKLDLAVANYLNNNVSVLLGNGDGTFQAARTFAVSTTPISVGVGDFNGDGKLDLAVPNFGGNFVSVLLGNGDGTFQPGQNFGTGSGPASVAVADFNGDSKLDLAMPDWGHGTIGETTTVSVLINTTLTAPGTTATPVLTPGGGTFTSSVQVTITDSTPGATIHYTIDGSTPTTASTVYTGPILVTQTTTIKAMAAAVGMTDSAVASATYTIVQQVATPTFSPAAGTYNSAQSVSISDATPGATIHYTTDGSTPTPASTVYTGPISVTQTTTIKAMATASGMTDSAVASATYTITIAQQVATPTFSPAGGTYVGPQTVTISDATSGATIYYTTDGSTPTTASTVYTGPILVAQTTTLKAMAAASGMTDSAVATATYTIRVLPPTFSPVGGTYNTPQSVSISDATPGATIYYTTDGSTPTTASTVYTGPILVAQTTTLKAMAAVSGMTDSAVASATYTITIAQQAATPTFSPAPGTYVGSVTVTLSDATSGATIYYTTDGTTPTTASTVYTGPILVTQTTTLKAMAAASGMLNSSVATATYTIRVATPTFSPAPGTYVGSVTVTLSDTTSGATIYYTTDGSTPTTASTVYTGPILVTQTTTLKARAAAAGMLNSAVATATYTIVQQTATPTFSPAPGTYVGSVTVTLSDTTSGATIYYTTDGTTPTTASTVYTGPILVTQTTTLKAMAAAAGMLNSGVASATYTIRVATPTFSPAPSTYVGSVTVTLSDTTSGATIYYTTDGTTPTTASAVYTGPILVTQTTTLKAMAAASGMLNSTVTTAIYTIRVTTPTFSPAGGTYNTPQSVSISDATPGATIYYTTDGSTPTTASTVYTGPISIAQTTTLKAMATASGMTDSTVATVTYTLQAATPTFSPPGGTYVLPQFVSISDASPGVTIYYTTDGSTPTTSSSVYSGPILVITPTTIRAMAVAPGWTQSPVASATYNNLLGL